MPLETDILEQWSTHPFNRIRTSWKDVVKMWAMLNSARTFHFVHSHELPDNYHDVFQTKIDKQRILKVGERKKTKNNMLRVVSDDGTTDPVFSAASKKGWHLWRSLAEPVFCRTSLKSRIIYKTCVLCSMFFARINRITSKQATNSKRKKIKKMLCKTIDGEMSLCIASFNRLVPRSGEQYAAGRFQQVL